MSREDYKKQVSAVAEEVINAINQPYGSVPYEKSDGTKGEYASTDDKEAIRRELLTYNIADDDKKLCPAFANQNYAHKIWTLLRGNDFIHLAI
jgi:hypothetical protein